MTSPLTCPPNRTSPPSITDPIDDSETSKMSEKSGITVHKCILSSITKHSTVVSHPSDDTLPDLLKIIPGNIQPSLPSWTLEDIELELTALVSIVPGCIYTFEGNAGTPVLYIPTNYAVHLRARKAKDGAAALLSTAGAVAVSSLRMAAVAGILLSLAILAIFAIALAVVAIVAASQNGGRGGRRGGAGIDQVIGLLRVVLWWDYLFGDRGNTFFFMNPNRNSYLYWMVIRNMIRRRRRPDHNLVNEGDPPPPQRRRKLSDMLSVLDRSTIENGVLNREKRNVLGIVDEFLFGPSEKKNLGGPEGVEDVWRLRAAVVIYSGNTRGITHPAQLMPYVDNPPPVPATLLTRNTEDGHEPEIPWERFDLSETMKVVVHFRGTPVRDVKMKGYYSFKGLMDGIDCISEGETGYAEGGAKLDGDIAAGTFRSRPQRYVGTLAIADGVTDGGSVEETGSLLMMDSLISPRTTTSTSQNSALYSFLNVLCGYSSTTSSSKPSEWRPGASHDLLFKQTNVDTAPIPPYLKMGHGVFTNLPPNLLLICVVISLINLISVHWVYTYGLALNGPLKTSIWPRNMYLLVKGIMWVMQWYSRMFVTVPVLRMVAVVVGNRCIEGKRETRRAAWANIIETHFKK